jgi:predicted dehydrogenase
MSEFSRRRFFEDSLLAAAALAVGPAAAAWAAPAKKAGPNDRLSVAILGVNGRGRDHIDGFLDQKETVITCVCDPDEAIGRAEAEKIAKKQGSAVKFERDLRKVFEDQSVDIVTIATPNHWHSLAAIWAMQAGKDVYVEKPLSHNVSEGRRCVETARKHKRICQVGTQCRSMGGSIDAVKFVHAGKIGAVKFARGLCYKRRDSIGPKGVYQVPASVDYNLWQGPATERPLTRPKFHYDWHWQYHWGNGDMGNQGPHQMDICRWGLKLDRLSERVIGYGGRLGYEDAGDVANTEVAIHQFGDKTIVFEVRGLKTPDYRGANVGVVFYGTEGYVVLSSYTGGAAFDLKGNQIETFKGGGKYPHYANFVKAVRSRKSSDLNADVLEGHLSAGLAHTGTISYRLGQPLPLSEIQKRLSGCKCHDNCQETLDRTVEHLKKNGVDVEKTKLALGPVLQMDPQTETFVGNDAANALLTRDYRKPFVVPPAGQV